MSVEMDDLVPLPTCTDLDDKSNDVIENLDMDAFNDEHEHEDNDIVPLPIEHDDGEIADENEETEDEGEIDSVPMPQKQESPVAVVADTHATHVPPDSSSVKEQSMEAPPLPLATDMGPPEHDVRTEIKTELLSNTASLLPPPPPPPPPHALSLDVKNIDTTSHNTTTTTTTSSTMPTIAPPTSSTMPSAPPTNPHYGGVHAMPPHYSVAASRYEPYHTPSKFVAPHLRPPPPLTPMSAIASNGIVIGDDTLMQQMQMPMPPPPHTHVHPHPHMLPYDAPQPPPPPQAGFMQAPPQPVAMMDDAGMPPMVPGQDMYEMMVPPPTANAPPPPPQPSYAIEYRCKQCAFLFNTKSELVAHRKIVHNEDAHSIKYEQQPYIKYENVEVPVGGGGGATAAAAAAVAYDSGGNVDNSALRPVRFWCNICQRSFGGKQHFEYHMRTHSGEKPFTCETCGKAFRAKHSLKNHLRIHTGERPYQCKLCGKWFRQLGVMKNHIKNMHSQ